MTKTTETLERAARAFYQARQTARQAARLAMMVRNGQDCGRDERAARQLARFARLRSERAERVALLEWAAARGM